MIYAVKATDTPDMQPIGRHTFESDAFKLACVLNECHKTKRYEVIAIEERN